MPGSQYIALSGLRTRMDQLDRLAADIANIGTAGYKGVHDVQAASERPSSSFSDVLQTAIDTTSDGQNLDMRTGALQPTGRPLDVAIDGQGFFVVQTKAGPRYTRNGHFTRSTDGTLTTDDGNPLLSTDGTPIALGDGDVKVEDDGTVWSGTQQSGKLAIVSFSRPVSADLRRSKSGQRRGSGGDAARQRASAPRLARTVERLDGGPARGTDERLARIRSHAEDDVRDDERRRWPGD